MSWPPQDPDGTYRHRALRVGITLPVVLALAMRFGPEASVAYAAFGVVASLALADFGGTTVRRAGAYATLGAIGVVNIVIGTLCSQHLVLGMAAALTVGAVARLVGVFGGYWGMGTFAALLAFVLAVTTKAGVDVLPARLGGWVFGCAASTLAALVLWPRHERHDFQRLAADAVRAIAAVLRDRSTAARHVDGAATVDASLVAAMHESVDAARRWLHTTPYRPAGPSAGDRALVELTMLLSRGAQVAQRVEPGHGGGPTPSELLEATAVQLDLAAAQLLGRGGPGLVTTTTVLDDARSHVVEGTQRWIAGLQEAGADELRDVDTAFHALLMSRLAEELTLCVTVLSGGDADAVAEAIGRDTERSSWTRDARQILGSHLSPRSAWFRESLRTGVGLCAAVGVAMATDLDHGFWIVLGTLSVLRTSARATSTTALRTITGTVIGFVLSAILVEVTSGSDTVLWIVLPFLAAGGIFVAGAMNDIWGQAAFTLLFVTLFDIIAPANWEVGLVRVETVGIGAGVSILVALVLWPRGAAQVVRTDMAAYFRQAGRLLHLTVAAAESGVRPEGLSEALTDEHQAHERARQACGEYLAESSAHALHWGLWARLLFVPSYTSFACRLIGPELQTDRRSPWPETAGQITTWGDRVAGTLAAMGDRLDIGVPGSDGAIGVTGAGATYGAQDDRAAGRTDAQLLQCLGPASDSTELAGAAVALAWARCWIADLDEVTEAARDALELVAQQPPTSRWSWHREHPVVVPPEVGAQVGVS